MALVIFVVLLGRTAPYGRHARAGWGPVVPQRLAWIVMEAVSPLTLWGVYLGSGGTFLPYQTLLLAVWTLHYLNRSLIYGLRARWQDRRMPVVVAGMAVFFNICNGTLNGWAIAGISGPPPVWSLGLGAALLLAGAVTNLHADEVLLRLRRPGEHGYQIPQGGMYGWVTAPNYLGEIVEWIGFAFLAQTPAAWSFAFWTFANLAPRARDHHVWYRAQFPDYPAQRKALVPYLF